MEDKLPPCRSLSLFVALLIAAASNCFSQVTVIVQDRFIDGGRTDGTDPLDVPWFSQGSGTSPTIVSDATTGPNEGGNDNALDLATGGQAARGLVGLLSNAITLSGTGAAISFSFDLRYTAAPPNSANGLRFGLYNSNGSAITADATNTSGNDIGYAARFPTGTDTTAVTIGEEIGAGGAGDLPTSGGDVVVLAGGTNGSFTSVSGTTNYFRFDISITRNSSNGLDFVVSQGVNTQSLTTAYSVTDATPATFSFDEIAIFNGVSNTSGFRIDNVLVTAVPEPATYTMLLSGLGVLIGGRCVFRRRAS